MPDTSYTVPVHVGIIMDGNGRWAKKRNLPRTMGHKEGLTTAKKIVAAAARLGIKYVTLYTFSTETWKRAQEEVGYLMCLIKGHLRAEFDFYKKNGIEEGKNLIVTYDENGALDSQKVEDIIQDIFDI